MTIARIGAMVLGLVVTGCSLLPGGGSPDLAGRVFLSTEVAVGGTEQPLVNGTQIRISFSEEGAMLSASAGCNTLAALYRIDGGVLSMSDGAMTEIGCQPDLAAQDDWLFGLLGAQPAVTLTGDELELEEGDTVITLLDREVADPDLPLIGPVWTVTAIVTGDTTTSVPEGIVATMVFTEDGLVMVNTGCNSGNGSVEIRTSTLVFGEMAMTRVACSGEAALMERAMLQVLGADLVRYAVDASQLELGIGGSGLQLTGINFQ
jgi:heat shock protein HslJ